MLLEESIDLRLHVLRSMFYRPKLIQRGVSNCGKFGAEIAYESMNLKALAAFKGQ